MKRERHKKTNQLVLGGFMLLLSLISAAHVFIECFLCCGGMKLGREVNGFLSHKHSKETNESQSYLKKEKGCLLRLGQLKLAGNGLESNEGMNLMKGNGRMSGSL